MRALFITTDTVDCANHVQAWNSFASLPAEHLTFRLHGIRNDWRGIQKAEEIHPEVIFYIGACKAPGLPKSETLHTLRKIAPLIHLCSDAADRPWHPVLAGYRSRGCFDLQVAIDGASHVEVDHSTLTPVDPKPFSSRGLRPIRCGFSGSIGRWNTRSEVVNALHWLGGLTLRERAARDGYQEHGKFLTRCRMLLNTSWTGTGHAHHVKGRVLEAGWAGCALLEHADSPITDWFGKDCYFSWRDVKEAAEIIRDASDQEINRRANQLAAKVRACFAPEMIYGEMLERVGLTEPRPPA